jgi:tRNA threonylcarbamoyladenosine biosynthesis protein TsaE
MTELEIRAATLADAPAMVAVIHRAFAARPVLDPPTPQLSESEASVASAIETDGGLLVLVDGEPAGTLLFDTSRGPDELGLRRVSVSPHWQGRGVATAMVGVAETTARRRGRSRLSLLARRELSSTVAFWQRRGYTEQPPDEGDPAYHLRLAKLLDSAGPLTVPDAAAMRLLGRVLAGELDAGDLVLLVGALGAGKTTLTRGIGEGLEVDVPVTSPTFVIARQHRTAAGPLLQHVDAYRLSGTDELDDLDLDSSAAPGVASVAAGAITVVEWGEGMAEQLSESRLVVRITRVDDHPTVDETGNAGQPGDGGEGERLVQLEPIGPRFLDGTVARVARRYTELLADRAGSS